jgi:hypothetical protein
MDTADPIVNDSVRVLLNRTIEALLSDSSIEQRLRQAKVSITKLERFANEVTEELNELKFVVDSLESSSEDPLSLDRELELTERLLTLYVNASEGALIF